MTRTPPACRTLSVLLVEDHIDIAWSTAVLIERHGHSVLRAWTGAGAMEAMAADPDVVILELRLRGGLSGLEVARRIRARAGGKPPFVVAVTGQGTDADRRRSADAGVDLHLVKPVDPAELMRVLARFARAIG